MFARHVGNPPWEFRLRLAAGFVYLSIVIPDPDLESSKKELQSLHLGISTEK